MSSGGQRHPTDTKWARGEMIRLATEYPSALHSLQLVQELKRENAALREVVENPPCTDPDCDCGASLDYEDDGWWCPYCEKIVATEPLTQAAANQRMLARLREGT
jgi:hypothetical protein